MRKLEIASRQVPEYDIDGADASQSDDDGSVEDLDLDEDDITLGRLHGDARDVDGSGDLDDDLVV